MYDVFNYHTVAPLAKNTIANNELVFFLLEESVFDCFLCAK